MKKEISRNYLSTYIFRWDLCKEFNQQTQITHTCARTHTCVEVEIGRSMTHMWGRWNGDIKRRTSTLNSEWFDCFICAIKKKIKAINPCKRNLPGFESHHSTLGSPFSLTESQVSLRSFSLEEEEMSLDPTSWTPMLGGLGSCPC